MADGNGKTTIIGEKAGPGPSYSELLDQDTREVPDFLREESIEDRGSEPLAAERYTSEAFMKLENEKMFRNIWHFAAREEEMQDPGDHVVYEIAGRSYLVVRQDDGGVRAFHNVCLHRGRKLATKSGFSKEFKCLFHGFTWNRDGSFKQMPCSWDFDHLEAEKMSLPELRVDRWQGFILVSEKQDIEPFVEWAGEATKHYERWNLDECYTAAWIGRVIPANWKATAEAFMEAWHSIETHPQILPFTGDSNTRYDIYGDHMNRAITPSAVLSPHIAADHDQKYILEKLGVFSNTEVDESAASKPESDAKNARRPAGDRFSDGSELMDDVDEDDPVYARKIISDANRELFGKQSGRDFSDISDSEMTDNFTYNIFPNWAPWGGFIPNIVYRWRPWGDPDHCLMEVRILMRNKEGEPMPKSAQMHMIGDDEPFASAGHLISPALAAVFDQDMANLPYVQEGLKASANNQVQLGNYQEIRIRQFHQTIDKYIENN